jgi:hypothetical protein
MKTGQWVEVRPKEEILGTLDKRGQLEGLPFMPQMFEYCGKRFRIYKIAHKTCDSVIVNGALQYKSRSMERTVHLESLRCNGLAHGGCNAACLIFWKEAWLKTSVEEPVLARKPEQEFSPSNHFGAKAIRKPAFACTEEDVRAGTRFKDAYVCQATQLSAATSPLSVLDLSQYVKDYRSGNVGLWRMACGFFYLGYYSLCNAGLKIGRPLRFLYDFFARLFGGVPYPRKPGLIPLGQPTPVDNLNLQPGELVRVKSFEAILATVDKYNRNRGMYFVGEQVPYCGRTFRVLRRMERIIDERSGRMVRLKTPAIQLEGAVCAGRYAEFCMFCPRSTYPYWREIWLERVISPKPTAKIS